MPNTGPAATATGCGRWKAASPVPGISAGSPQRCQEIGAYARAQELGAATFVKSRNPGDLEQYRICINACRQPPVVRG